MFGFGYWDIIIGLAAIVMFTVISNELEGLFLDGNATWDILKNHWFNVWEKKFSRNIIFLGIAGLGTIFCQVL